MGAISLSSIQKLAKKAGSSIPNQSSNNNSNSISGGLGSTISNYASGFKSEIASDVTGAEDYIGNLLGNGSSSLESNIGSIADAVGNKVSSLFGSKDNSTTASLDKTTSDPLKTTTANGTPKSTTFSTNSQYAQTQPINLQNTSSGNRTTASFSTLLSRVQGAATSTKSSVFNIANGLTHNSVVDSLYHTVQDGVSTVSDTVNSVENNVSGVTNTVSSIYKDMTSEFSSVINSLGATPSSLKSIIDSGLPITADANGKAIPGVPSNVSAGKLSSLYGLARSLGCSIEDAGFTKYGATQTMKGLLLEISSRLNMTNLFRQMTNCTQFQDATSMSSIRNIFTNSATTHPGIANIASQAINDASQTPVSHDLARAMVTNSDLTASDSSDLSDIFHRVGVSTQSVYSVAGVNSKSPVYDSDTFSASPKYTSTALLGNDTISDMVNDIPLN